MGEPQRSQMMVMRRNFKSNAFWSAFGTLLPIAIGAVSIPFFLLNLDRHGFSLYIVCLSIISFAPSLDFGVSRTAFRRVAIAMSGGALAVRLQAVEALKRAVMVSAWVVIGLLFAIFLAFFLGRQDAVPLLSEPAPVLIAVLGLFPAIIGNVQRSIVEGAGLFSESAISRVVIACFSSLAPLGLSFLTKDVAWLCVTLVAFRFLAVIHQNNLLIRKELVATNWWKGREYVHNWHDDFWSESRWYAILAPASLLMSGYDKLLISLVSGLDLSALAEFVAPQELALKAIIIPAAIIPAMSIKLVHDGASYRPMKFAMYGLCLGVLMAGVLVGVFIDSFSRVLFPRLEMALINQVALIMIIGVFSNAVAQFPAMALAMTGRVKLMAVLQVGELLVYLCVMPILVSSWGVIGAAWCWTGRTMVDTAVLLWLARASVPGMKLFGFHLVHVFGVTVLIFVLLQGVV